MTPIKYALVWVLEYVIFMLVLAAGYAFFPEHALYRVATSQLGVIQGDNWDSFYFIFLSVLSVLITAVLIALTVAVQRRKRQ